MEQNQESSKQEEVKVKDNLAVSAQDPIFLGKV